MGEGKVLVLFSTASKIATVLGKCRDEFYSATGCIIAT